MESLITLFVTTSADYSNTRRIIAPIYIQHLYYESRNTSKVRTLFLRFLCCFGIEKITPPSEQNTDSTQKTIAFDESMAPVASEFVSQTYPMDPIFHVRDRFASCCLPVSDFNNVSSVLGFYVVFC